MNTHGIVARPESMDTAATLFETVRSIELDGRERGVDLEAARPDRDGILFGSLQ